MKHPDDGYGSIAWRIAGMEYRSQSKSKRIVLDTSKRGASHRLGNKAGGTSCLGLGIL